jgi:hypothetical protein
MASPTLMSRLRDFANKISGVSYVDNMQNPQSAAYKTAQSIRTPAQQKALGKSTLPKQQVYGVPGISQRSQLPKQYQ